MTKTFWLTYWDAVYIAESHFVVADRPLVHGAGLTIRGPHTNIRRGPFSVFEWEKEEPERSVS